MSICVEDSNNRAIQLLRDGQVTASMEILLQAVAEIKDLLSKEGLSTHSESAAPSVNELPLPRKEMKMANEQHHQPRNRSCLSAVGIPKREMQNQDDAMGLYDRPFLLNGSEGFPRELVCCTLLFNLALTNHLRGMEEQNIRFIKSALRLYEIGAEVLLQSDEWSKGAHLLLLTCYNNIAHGYASLCIVDDYTNEIQHALVETLHHHWTSFIDEDDYAFFYLNILVCEGGRGVLLAPAA